MAEAEAVLLPHRDSVAATAPPRGLRRPGWSGRLRFWRSPEGQPPWARPGLLAVAAIAAIVYAWHIANTGYAYYYAVAVKSMSVSWRALFYGAYDPGATVTIDKLAGAFVPQALAARVFGFHQWSLALPQVVEGVVAVLVMYRIVRRWLGPAAGLIAAGLFASTPIVTSMFGHPMEDGALTTCLVLAADALVIALHRARPGWLAVAGAWIGLGFQAKMLEAWVVLPACAAAYLICAPAGWRRRLGHVALFGAVTAAVSLSWVTLFALTPADARPYVDATTNNSAFAMVFGYNGLERLGVHLPGAVVSGFTDAAAPHTWYQLFAPAYATQIGWLYPLALVALVVGLRYYRRDRPVVAGFVLWGLWLAAYATVFSQIVLVHKAYLAALAPPLAALAAAGLVLGWPALREHRAVLLVAVTVVAEAAWTVYLAQQYPDFLPWLRRSVLGAAALAVAACVVVAPRRPAAPGSSPAAPRFVLAATALAVVAAVATPVGWGLSVLDPRYAGSAFEAGAGASGPVGVPLDADTTDTLTPPESALDRYLLAHRGGATYLAASTSRTAGRYILATGQPFLPVGGFAGTAPSPTLAQLQAMVSDGRLRFFLIAVDGLLAGDTELHRILSWVATECVPVPAAEHGDGDALLYRCGP